MSLSTDPPLILASIKRGPFRGHLASATRSEERSRAPEPRRNSHFWYASLLIFFLFALAAHFQRAARTTDAPLLLLLAGLSMLAVRLPIYGPRGQRIEMLPGVGAAALLLLPVALAPLPLLFASLASAAPRDTVAARQAAWERALCLAAALLIGGLSYQALRLPGLKEFFSSAASALALYGASYVTGRIICLRRQDSTSRAARLRLWAGWRWEAAALLASAPAALLMAAAHPRFGVAGVAAAAILMALVWLVAHFGFEAAALKDQVRAMERISALSLSQASLGRLAERFLQLSASLIFSDRAVLWLTDDSGIRLERVAHQEEGAPPTLRTPKRDAAALEWLAPIPALRFGEGAVGRAADSQAPVIVRETARASRLAVGSESREARGARSLVLMPLVAGGETVGVAQFERDAPGRYTAHDVSRIQSLANQAAAMLANVRMHQAVYSQAVTDGLTGLYNRRHMQAALLDEQRRALRYGRPLSVIMLDVDGFKSYNDTYGHTQGDVLLQSLAQILRETLRGSDIIGRYGGEEFIVLMPETAQEDAWQTTERLRLAVALALFPGHADDPNTTVFKTVSLGIATCPTDTNDPRTLVTLADQALYRAKRGGRNQTVLASAPAIPQLVD